MELRGKGRDDQAGRLGDEPRRRDGSEAEEPNAAEPPTVDSAEQVVVRPPGDERPLAELLADPELRLARGDEKVGDVQAGRLGDEPRQRVDSEAEEPKAEESTAGESAEQAVVRPPGDERPLTELLADPELRLAGAEALELDAPMEWLDEAEQLGLVIAPLEREELARGSEDRVGPAADQSPVREIEFQCVQDVLHNPRALEGRSPGEVRDRISGEPGWREETLGYGTHEGQGWMLRHYTDQGTPTGRYIRWHPGGGHHGPDPYWRVSDGTTKSPLIAGGPNDLSQGWLQ